MGTFRVDVSVQNVADKSARADVAGALVDTGSELTWLPGEVLARIGVEPIKRQARFVTANGQTLTREVGYAVLHVAGTQTVDEVVFGLAGDLVLLGARTLEGLNVHVDAPGKRLVAAGPMPAA